MNTFFKITGYLLIGANIAGMLDALARHSMTDAGICLTIAWLVFNEARKLH